MIENGFWSLEVIFGTSIPLKMMWMKVKINSDFSTVKSPNVHRKFKIYDENKSNPDPSIDNDFACGDQPTY